MNIANPLHDTVPSWQLYGEQKAFPDILHCERIIDRAADLAWHISPHRHAHLHQFLFIRSGEFMIHSEGETHRPKVPCIVSIPRDFVHGFSFSPETEGYVVTVPLQSLPDIFSPQAKTATVLSRFAILAPSPVMESIFDLLHAEHEARHPARSVLLRAYASQLAIRIMRESLGEGMHATLPDNPLFRHFEDMVAAQFRNGWRVNDYAEAMGISARHLGRLCHEAKGLSPTAYLEKVVMQEACRLLVYTRSSISAIGYQLGFEDPAYFSRVFRRCWDVSPSAYRAKFEAD